MTYSAGPFGGARAAMALRPMLSELGCLPVSKLCCLPTANELFGADGTPVDAAARTLKQLPEMLSQVTIASCCLRHGQRGRPQHHPGTSPARTCYTLKHSHCTMHHYAMFACHDRHCTCLQLEWMAIAMKRQREYAGKP